MCTRRCRLCTNAAIARCFPRTASDCCQPWRTNPHVPAISLTPVRTTVPCTRDPRASGVHSPAPAVGSCCHGDDAAAVSLAFRTPAGEPPWTPRQPCHLLCRSAMPPSLSVCHALLSVSRPLLCPSAMCISLSTPHAMCKISALPTMVYIM